MPSIWLHSMSRSIMSSACTARWAMLRRWPGCRAGRRRSTLPATANSSRRASNGSEQLGRNEKMQIRPQGKTLLSRYLLCQVKRKRALRGRNHAEGYPGGLIADDDQLGAVRDQRRPENPKEIHRTDRSSCLENPRPKGGIFLPFGETPALIFTLNQNSDSPLQPPNHHGAR